MSRLSPLNPECTCTDTVRPLQKALYLGSLPCLLPLLPLAKSNVSGWHPLCRSLRMPSARRSNPCALVMTRVWFALSSLSLQQPGKPPVLSASPPSQEPSPDPATATASHSALAVSPGCYQLQKPNPTCLLPQADLTLRRDIAKGGWVGGLVLLG